MQPEEYQYIASATASTADPIQPVGVGFDIFAVIYHILGSNETTSSLLSLNGIVGFLNILWGIFVFFSFLISITMLALYAYASTRRWQYYALGDKELRDAEDMYDELYRGIKKNSRMDDVFAHIESENPNDWKLAIIEADIILDDLLKERGFIGNTLGERLKSISPSQLATLNDAWEAHKIRNHIAHEGADFVLTYRLAQDTINRYRRVFTEFGV
jgi:hypothetical protein